MGQGRAGRVSRWFWRPVPFTPGPLPQPEVFNLTKANEGNKGQNANRSRVGHARIQPPFAEPAIDGSYPGAIYHVMNRGDHREDIFRSRKDRELFLKTLSEACGKTDWQVHAWCLMRNHFHLVVETPRANLVPGMKWLLGTYTMRFNHRHRLFGHLFSGRYKALPVDCSGSGYLKSVCDYV